MSAGPCPGCASVMYLVSYPGGVLSERWVAAICASLAGPLVRIDASGTHIALVLGSVSPGTPCIASIVCNGITVHEGFKVTPVVN